MESRAFHRFRAIARGIRRPALLAFCLLLLAPAHPQAGTRAGRWLDLTLLHTNDIHGHMLPYDYGDQTNVGGAARRATLIDRIKRDAHHPVLVIDSGDVVTRGPLWTEFEGKLDIDVMNALAYDLAAVGNNEFKVRADRSAQGVLLSLVRRSHFPWLCANAFDGSGGYLPAVKPSLIRTIEGFGCQFVRHGGKHDWYQNPLTGVSQPVPRHREINVHLARRVIRMPCRGGCGS